MTLFASQKSSRWISILYYFSCLILFISLLNLIGSYGSGQWDTSTILSSDALYIPRFYRDVLAHGSVADWNLPPNPYFFPDMLLFIPLDLLSHLTQSNVY